MTIVHDPACIEYNYQRPGCGWIERCEPVDRATFNLAAVAHFNATSVITNELLDFLRDTLRPREKAAVMYAIDNGLGGTVREYVGLAAARAQVTFAAPAFDTPEAAWAYMRDQREVADRFPKDRNTQTAKSRARNAAKGLHTASAQQQYRGADVGRTQYMNPTLYNPLKTDLDGMSRDLGLPVQALKGRASVLPPEGVPAYIAKRWHLMSASDRAPYLRAGEPSLPGQPETLAERRQRQTRDFRGDVGAGNIASTARAIGRA